MRSFRAAFATEEKRDRLLRKIAIGEAVSDGANSNGGLILRFLLHGRRCVDDIADDSDAMLDAADKGAWTTLSTEMGTCFRRRTGLALFGVGATGISCACRLVDDRNCAALTNTALAWPWILSNSIFRPAGVVAAP